MTIPPANVSSSTKKSEEEIAPEDFYMDGPYVVFTEAYHRKRGYCCESGCRHCPYRED
jgi:hypothetical protein